MYTSLDVVAINLIFAGEEKPSAGVIKSDVEMETEEQKVEVVLTNAPDNDFVNFQLGEFMFNVGVYENLACTNKCTTSVDLISIFLLIDCEYQN